MCCPPVGGAPLVLCFLCMQAFLTLKHETGVVHNLLLKESAGVLTAKLVSISVSPDLPYLTTSFTPSCPCSTVAVPSVPVTVPPLLLQQ